ncbi:tetratricopeptide repeat protein [Neolewinella aquimaris]|nr:tetratricopeptide repeat protein [Neolewinella aquimaris]
MFTDIVGYTALMQHDEAEARVKRNRHREVFQAAHEEYRGEILQYYGDGTLSSFESAVDAVECGIEIQRQLRQAPKVALRIGIHLGETVTEDDGVYGDGVNIASRVESFSIPGAVLVTDAVFDQIKNQPHLPTEFMGKFHFKNVDRPTGIYALSTSGLTVPEKNELAGKGHAMNSATSDLPLQLTSFIGRDEEIGEVRELILRSRLVTLSGPGGTGKTRLALKVGESFAEQFEHGLYWVPLASASDVSSVELTISKVLDLVQDPFKNTVDQLTDFFSNKEALLILDNFEQVIDAAPIIGQILSKCPGVKILVTSRIVLHLQGEQEYPVNPLQVPTLNGNRTAEHLLKNPAVSLFSQRARAVKPSFALNDENAAAIARICHRLDGLPLAIELAAARIKLFSPDALLRRLDHQLDLLKGSSPNRPERHQTLRQAIKWSYELLPPPERTLFHRLSVFSGGCDLDAIEAVCAGSNIAPEEVVDLVLALVDKSLLNRKDDTDGEPRFSMLETIRAFAFEALSYHGDRDAVQRAHATYFVSKAERAEPYLTGPDQARWFSALEADLSNFREVVTWLFANREYEMALRLGKGLTRLWFCRNMLTEGVQLAKRLLDWETPEHLSRLKAKITQGLIATYFYDGSYAEAVGLGKKNLAFWREIGDELEIANALNHLGFALINVGSTREGIAYTNEALEMHVAKKDFRGEAVSYNNLGWAYLNAGIPLQAAPALERSLELRKQIRDERGIGFATINLARARGALGQYPQAVALFEEGLRIVKRNMDKVVIIWGLVNFAQLHHDMANIKELRRMWRENQNDVLTKTNLHYILDGWDDFIEGILAGDKGLFAEADDWIQRGIDIFHDKKMVHYVNKGWYYRSKIAYDAGKIDKAWEYLKNSLDINVKYSVLLGTCEVFEFAGVILADTGELEKAALALAKGRCMRSELGAPTPTVIKPYLQKAREVLETRYSADELAAISERGSNVSRDEAIRLVGL